MVDKGIPRHDYLINDASGKTIGRVTSGTQSPTLGRAIGMGYVASEHALPEGEIFVSVRDKQLKAKLTKMPFVQG
jgi:aminomethyltransferase